MTTRIGMPEELILQEMMAPTRMEQWLIANKGTTKVNSHRLNLLKGSVSAFVVVFCVQTFRVHPKNIYYSVIQQYANCSYCAKYRT